MNAKPATDLLKREFAWLQGILVVVLWLPPNWESLLQSVRTLQRLLFAWSCPNSGKVFEKAVWYPVNPTPSNCRAVWCIDGRSHCHLFTAIDLAYERFAASDMVASDYFDCVSCHLYFSGFCSSRGSKED